MSDADWCVGVFRCKSDAVERTIIDLYNFARDLHGVRDLHFIIRDRLNDDVVFSFRFLIDPKYRKIIESKIVYQLSSLVSKDNFSINPRDNDPLAEYSAWSPNEKIAKCGPEKFILFCNLLSQLSKIVVDMARNKYFDSSERVEIARAMSWMLGLTEYGLLSTEHVEIGYHDRIDNKNHICFKEAFAE